MNKKGARRQKPLTKKEMLFCELYAGGLDHRAAAAEAGFSPPRTAGMLLLLRRDISAEINSYKKQKRAHHTAAEGLRRLAFGPVTDAVRLAFCEPDARTCPETLDLFNVSEIKVKGDAVEIKFFDRIKALSELCELEGDSGNESSGLLEAIIKSAGGRRAATECYDEV